MLPYLYGVDAVLPKDVAARAYRCQWVQIGVGNPDGKGGVLLSQCLSCLVSATEVVANPTAHGKLHDAEHQSQQGYHRTTGLSR